MLLIILRKMLNNPWMIFCLLIGCVLAVAITSSIPIYTEGVLHRMLIRDLENFQADSGYFPGYYLIKADMSASFDDKDTKKIYETINGAMDMVESSIGLPILCKTQILNRDFFTALPEKQRTAEPKKFFASLESVSGIEDHVSIVHGRMFSTHRTDGLIEVIVTEQAMQKFDLYLDEIYVLSDFVEVIKEPIHVRVVGVFTIKDNRDPFWYQGLWPYHECFIMDFPLLHKMVIESIKPLYLKIQWFYAFDYHKLTLDKVREILDSYESQKQWLKGYWNIEIKVPSIPILKQYYEREKQLRATLWVLQLPILLMLAFYVFMVSQLIIGHEKNEIAVIKSRGASISQVFITYLLESLLLSAAAVAAGPPLGLLLCRILGASNGFLEFVQRTALPLSLSVESYIYSLLAVAVFMATMLIPAFLSSRTTIVLYKQKKTRGRETSIWKKYFLDVIMLAVSGYGLYQYQIRQKTLEITGAGGIELIIDPLLYMISTLFVLGAGLVFLRLFPLIIRFIFYLGKNNWSPVLYASLIHVGRSGGKDQFLMLFLTLTLSLGIFNSSAARTLNTNIEEKIQYSTGTDITIQNYWESNEPDESLADPMDVESIGQDPSAYGTEAIIYREPPFLPYTRLLGVERATKVFQKEKISVLLSGADRIRNVNLMGIIPNEFGRVAWFRSDLLRHHWYHYLNLLSQNPMAALVSRSFGEDHNVEPGDTLSFSWGKQGFLEVIVYGFVDYWPAFNPNISASGKKKQNLIVANLSYIHAKMAMEPYEIWLKKKDGASSELLYKDMENKNLKVENLLDSGQQIITRKNDPMLQGTNGVLSLGFIVTMFISIIGFLIYWIITIQERVLQFGILRAIGLSSRKIIGMLVCEQLLISGTAILIGIIIGGIASDLFVPLLQLVYSAAEQVPPFKVVAYRSDYIKIYMIVISMLAAGSTVLGIITSRIKIHQAIKLGEE